MVPAPQVSAARRKAGRDARLALLGVAFVVVVA